MGIGVTGVFVAVGNGFVGVDVAGARVSVGVTGVSVDEGSFVEVGVTDCTFVFVGLG